MDNKDYIINIRVSRATYDKIKEKAKENKESISHVVRKAIEDSSEIIGELADEIFGRKKEERRNDITNYYKSTSAKQLRCEQCSETIEAGEAVTVGEAPGHKKYFFCSRCKQ